MRRYLLSGYSTIVAIKSNFIQDTIWVNKIKLFYMFIFLSKLMHTQESNTGVESLNSSRRGKSSTTAHWQLFYMFLLDCEALRCKSATG